jgi:hypothetical protein
MIKNATVQLPEIQVVKILEQHIEQRFGLEEREDQ